MDLDLITTELFPNDTFKSDILNFTSYANVSTSDQVTIYDVPVSIICILATMYGLVSLLAVLGNLLVLWIVCSTRRMQTVTNYFIANLAVADIIIGAFAIPFQFQAALLQRWVLPFFMCSFCPFVQVLSVNVSISTLTAIALDRYRAVIYPLMARTTALKAKVIITCIWVFSAVFSVPCGIALRIAIVEDSTVPNGTKPFCRNEGLSPEHWRMYNHCLVFLQYFVPLCLISFAYARMGAQLKKWNAPGNAQTDRDAIVMKNKRKVIKMFFIVVTLFAVCWLPLQVYNAVQDIFPDINKFKYINIIWFSFHWLAMSNSCCNPFIYAIYNERFNREFRRKFPCIFSRNQEANLMTDSGMGKSINHRTNTSRMSEANLVRTEDRSGGLKVNVMLTNRSKKNGHFELECDITNSSQL